MKLTRTSILTTKSHTLEIDVTDEQLARWEAGAYIQDVCPHLSNEDREFIISGITPSEWELHMLPEDEEQPGIESV